MPPPAQPRHTAVPPAEQASRPIVCLCAQELIDANGTTVVVQRDRSLPTANDLLPELHASRVGERILSWADENFPNIAPRVPAAPTAGSLTEGVRQIAAIFALNEFMLQDSLEPLPGGNGLEWTLVAPATMWSSQTLRVRGDRPSNDFEAKAVIAYLRRCGVPASYSSKYTSTQVRAHPSPCRLHVPRAYLSLTHTRSALGLLSLCTSAGDTRVQMAELFGVKPWSLELRLRSWPRVHSQYHVTYRTCRKETKGSKTE